MSADNREALYRFAMRGKERSPDISEKASALIDAFRDEELVKARAELRAEVLAESQREVVAWLDKKAREYRSVGGPSADTIQVLTSKVHRGAIRIFQDQSSPSCR
jgi:hypothetical protein